MLPDINANDRDKTQERILVGSGGNLQTLGGRVQTLNDESESAKMIRIYILRTSHPQPDP
jgi:hypothetical protein